MIALFDAELCTIMSHPVFVVLSIETFIASVQSVSGVTKIAGVTEKFWVLKSMLIFDFWFAPTIIPL